MIAEKISEFALILIVTLLQILVPIAYNVYIYNMCITNTNT